MLKEQYNKNRPRKQCPNCGTFITNACFSRHYQACVNPHSKYNLYKNNVVDRGHCEDLRCMFCAKDFQSKNARAQHEIRCKENPNRKDHEHLTKYIQTYRKGKTAANCAEISKQRQTMLDKYANGYQSPILGKAQKFDYLYKEHNNAEIDKWLAYINTKGTVIPLIQTTPHSARYRILSKHQYSDSGSIKLVFEHNYIANILLEGNLQSENQVHHINKQRDDNDIHNLMIFDTDKSHKRYHTSKYAYLIYDNNSHLFKCELQKC